MGPWIRSQVQEVNGTMDLTPQQTQAQGVNGLNQTINLTPQQTKVQGINGTMDLTPQQTQVQGVNGTIGFDPTTDKCTWCKWDHGFYHKSRV